MKIVIAPDSFKGSLTALKVGTIIKEAFSKELPDVDLEVIPMADGGEGTLDTLIYATDGTRKSLTASGPLLDPVETEYGVLGDNKTAVIEIAAISGLPMVPPGKRNPIYTSTFGIGEVIKQALEDGYRELIVGLGGSSTNDGGLGMLQALGARFLDEQDETLPSFGSSLFKLKRVDFTGLHPLLKEAKFTIASDVNNPLTGPNGATYVFGPQKGIADSELEAFDQAMGRYANLVENQIGLDLKEQEGAGAAGGLGFAFLILNARIESGSKIVADATRLQEKIVNADFVITGEGQSDYQTLLGKVPSFISSIAKEAGVKTILLSGSLGKGYEALYDHFLSCHSIATGPMSLGECMDNAEILLYNQARNIALLIKGISEECNNQVSI
ncbi:glycerate kinase [Mesobacillus persicus]|uniref:Glycerate kinase n=1 Tax=Mesobacillus persicus TaxID=930146 RepID=A0A1H7Z5G5_9BACI|nr:glycerate kinase [Mesobacillus persicus]SEM53463.1 glycerate kinase [Mesobacillus persicus]